MNSAKPSCSSCSARASSSSRSSSTHRSAATIARCSTRRARSASPARRTSSTSTTTLARARMSGLMASVAIERFAGIETVPHLTPRDSTITGLESQLLGAHAEGVRNILAVTGDPPEEADYPGARGVYEVDAIGLTDFLAHLNRGEDFRGRTIDAPTQFHIGVAVNPTADDLDVELERFARKLDAGAQFAMTQVLFDIAYLDTFLERLGGESPIPLLVGVWSLPSLQLAQR